MWERKVFLSSILERLACDFAPKGISGRVRTEPLGGGISLSVLDNGFLLKTPQPLK